MKIYLSHENDPKFDQEGDIVNCVLLDNKINILFHVFEDGMPVQGRLSLKATEERQKTKGTWIYPETQKENSRISETQKDSESEVIESEIEGILEEYDGDKVVFSGTWKDKAGTYNLSIEAKITEQTPAI